MRQETKTILKTAGLGVSKLILMTLFAGAVVVAPGGVAGVMEVLDKFTGQKSDEGYRPKQVSRALRYLKSRKLLDIQRQYQKEVFVLTKLGYFRARKLAKSFAIAKPEQWDGKWRIIIFDVPETKKQERDIFRQQLKNLGLANLQKSIWIYPYECRDQIYYLAGNLFIKPYVRYIVAAEITGEKDLRRRFEI